MRKLSIQGRCGSYIGPESRVCARWDSPRCSVKDESGLSRRRRRRPFNQSQTYSDLHRLILLRILRPDSVLSAVRAFITANLGADFALAAPPPFDLAKSFGESCPSRPLILLLSPGADPVADIERFAATQEQPPPPPARVTLSLGQGQVCLSACRCQCREARPRRARARPQAPDEGEYFAGPGGRLRDHGGGRAGRVGDIAELSPRRGLDPDAPA